MPNNLKKKLYDHCILPVFTHGTETWSFIKKLAHVQLVRTQKHERYWELAQQTAKEKHEAEKWPNWQRSLTEPPNLNGNGPDTSTVEITTDGPDAY